MAALLAAAPHQRRAQADPGARRRQRARALHSPDLVGRKHERVGAERGDAAIDPPGHLHRVAEDEAARRVNQRRRLGDRLNDAGLVVCALQRQERTPRTAAGGLEPVEVEPAVGPQGRDLRRRKAMAGEDAAGARRPRR